MTKLIAALIAGMFSVAVASAYAGEMTKDDKAKSEAKAGDMKKDDAKKKDKKDEKKAP